MAEPFNPFQAPAAGVDSPRATKSDDLDAGPSGLGGWLILVGIGLVTAPLRLGAFVVTTFVPVFQNGAWGVLTTPGTEQYHPLWGPLLIFEIVGNVAFILTYVVLAVLFFRKSCYFPRLYIAAALTNIGFIIVDMWLARFVLPNEPMFDPETTKELTRSVVGAAIWVPYMMVSKRVRNTFVE